jgi:hypothetical protein
LTGSSLRWGGSAANAAPVFPDVGLLRLLAACSRR